MHTNSYTGPGQNGKEIGKRNPVESICFDLGFANAGQTGGNYCEQNLSSRINTESEGLVCLNLDVMMCRKLVKRWVNTFFI
jgi:hypothetical protein